MRIHLVTAENLITLCGRSTDDVVDCITVDYYLEHYFQGTEEALFTLAQTAMIVSRLVRAICQIETPDPEPADSDSPMCEECSGYAGFEILARYATEQDED